MLGNDILKKYKDDINDLEKIAAEQNNKLNLSMLFIAIKCEKDEEQDLLTYFANKGIEIVNEDVEPDEGYGESDSEHTIRPFDPGKIDIRFSQMVMRVILDRIRYKELDFESDFQRKAGLWNKVQKSQLIESIFLKIPLPAFYFDASDDDKWIIIDGLQRISTLREFAVDKTLRLTGMEFLHDLNGKTYDEIPRSLQRRLDETNITAYVVNPATPPNVKYNIFKRINTGGLVLEPQEIRNALFQGAATAFLRKISQNEAFVQATCGSIKTERMLDREFCLRFVAFTFVPLSKYNGNLEEHLNNTMEHLNHCTAERLEEIEQSFEETMLCCKRLFGRYAFRKMGYDGRRRPINKALFEAWSAVLHHMDTEEKDRLLSQHEKLVPLFTELCESYQFQSLLRNSDRASVTKRINEIEKIIGSVLGGMRIQYVRCSRNL